MEELEFNIVKAMERIESLFLETNGKLYIAWSGGKDSTVLLQLCKMCYDINSIPFLPKAVFSDTGVELQATRDFVKWCKDSGWYPNIEIIKPKKSFVQCINEYGKPMVSKTKSQFIASYQRAIKKGNELTSSRLLLLLYGKSHIDDERSTSKYKLANRNFNILHPEFDIKVSDKCCYVLKKRPFEDYAIDNDMYGYMDGEMNDEGGARESANQKRVKSGGKVCTKTKYIAKLKRSMIVKMPIVDWSKEIEDEFIKKYNVPISKAYTEYGCKRTGCAMCPYAQFSKDVVERLKILYYHEPKMYKFAMATMKNVYIAQNIKLPFDSDYEYERTQKWLTVYEKQRYEMICKYRKERSEKYKLKNEQLKLF